MISTTCWRYRHEATSRPLGAKPGLPAAGADLSLRGPLGARRSSCVDVEIWSENLAPPLWPSSLVLERGPAESALAQVNRGTQPWRAGCI